MIKGIKYNTALLCGKSVSNNQLILTNEFKNENVHVFQHDLCVGTHEYYKQCDAIYSEPAWQHGYNKFVMNTIANKTTFDDYLKSMSAIIRELNVPAFILCGKHMLNRLQPDTAIETFLDYHKCDAYYAIYNYNDCLANIKCQLDMIEYVTSHFSNILDFCCGYNDLLYNSAKKYNSSLILSDVNVECLNYIINREKN